MRLRSLRTALAVTAVAGLLLAACGDDPNDIEDARRADAAAATTAPSASNLQGTITVMAASSLTDAFDEVATAFKASNPHASVELNFEDSSALRDQILGGTPADVFAAADTTTMDAVAEADALGADPQVFATGGPAAGDDVEGSETSGDNVVAQYPIARLAASQNPQAAQAFVRFVLSERGQEILGSYGFDPPA
ncbi:MAG TPA: extracellular solute-binding protein [Acidimicrobiales bacterium]|jgi:ABC-type molybdate transport system substrate-binding protein|nr:extracellular solute-binding protein [Acidimicrobiales bacterium]